MEKEMTETQQSYSKPDETRMFPLIEEQRQSGLTIKAFCQTKGIAPHSYYYWNKKYQNNRKKQTNNNKPSFTRLQILEEAPGRLFCELTTLSGGKLRFYQSVPAAYLQSLL
ncbi:MAG: IS66 family insertion sequence element accessory protein TnpA [Chitinophagaceae bacterium]